MKINECKWLINLPHAGGSINVFKGWNKKIECNVLNIEYPGHWTRMKEPMVSTFSELALDVINIIKKEIPKTAQLYLFGHSIGAILSWYISPIMIKEGYDVKGLFLSASQNPGSFPEDSILHLKSDGDLLKLIGYSIEEHDETINSYFMNIFLPILKCDMNICKSFIDDGHYVDVNSLVLYGDEDIFTNITEMKKWGEYVNMKDIYGFHGGHLYIENKDNYEKIIELINCTIRL